MKHAGHDVDRDQVARLMWICGISGAVRGKRTAVTATADPAASRYPNLVKRQW